MNLKLIETVIMKYHLMTILKIDYIYGKSTLESWCLPKYDVIFNYTPKVFFGSIVSLMFYILVSYTPNIHILVNCTLNWGYNWYKN